jgi:hypothetical protein
MVGAGRLAAIPATSTFAEMADRWHLQVMRAKFATNARKGVDASLVMKLEILLVVKSHLFIFSWNWHGRMAAIPLCDADASNPLVLTAEDDLPSMNGPRLLLPNFLNSVSKP